MIFCRSETALRDVRTALHLVVPADVIALPCIVIHDDIHIIDSGADIRHRHVLRHARTAGVIRRKREGDVAVETPEELRKMRDAGAYIALGIGARRAAVLARGLLHQLHEASGSGDGDRVRIVVGFDLYDAAHEVRVDVRRLRVAVDEPVVFRIIGKA